MFGINYINVCIRLVIAFALATVMATSHAMNAYSITQKVYLEEEGKQFWQIRVRCTDLITKRFIVRQSDDGPWCAKELPNFCGINKVQAAVNICSIEYSLALRENGIEEVESIVELSEKPVELDAVRSELLQEQEMIQSQRIEIAQRKLDLRRRELDLRERELNLLNRINSLR